MAKNIEINAFVGLENAFGERFVYSSILNFTLGNLFIEAYFRNGFVVKQPPIKHQ